MSTTNSVKLEPCYQGHREMLGIPLNPADASNNNGHYFSGPQSQYHWDLYGESQLIVRKIKKVDVDETGNKVYADDVVFRGNSINRKGWRYGIHDLVSDLPLSDSSRVPVEPRHCERIVEIIREEKPDTVVLFGKKVQEELLNHLHFGTEYGVNHGEINEMIPGCPTRFFLLAFPSRKNEDSYSFSRKLEKFIKIREYLDRIHP